MQGIAIQIQYGYSIDRELSAGIAIYTITV